MREEGQREERDRSMCSAFKEPFPHPLKKGRKRMGKETQGGLMAMGPGL